MKGDIDLEGSDEVVRTESVGFRLGVEGITVAEGDSRRQSTIGYFGLTRSERNVVEKRPRHMRVGISLVRRRINE